jgi:hypothetical protein
MYQDASLFVHDNRSWMELCEENGWPVAEEVIDYGESFDGMAAHVSEMSGLQRILFEDCEAIGGKVVAPHMNLKPYPHWLCPEYVARKIGCELHEATDLLDCWVILDAGREMVETFISWVKVKGVEKALPYFEKLAFAVAEVENIDPEDVTEPEEPDYAPVDPYAYHVVGEDLSDEEHSWMDRQPEWYQALIRKVDGCKDLDELASLGKDVYQRNLSHAQAGVFWTQYKLAKKRLEEKIELGTVARSFIRRIAGANGNLPSLGAWLYKVQQGHIKVAHAPEKREWTLIWKAYREAKPAHDASHEACL